MGFQIYIQPELPTFEFNQTHREELKCGDYSNMSLLEDFENQKEMKSKRARMDASFEFQNSTNFQSNCEKSPHHDDDHLNEFFNKCQILKQRYVLFPGEIGKGKFGIVKRCLDTHSGNIFACKSISTNNSTRAASLMRSANAEIEAAKLLSGHANIILFQDVAEDSEGVVQLVMELCNQGDLYELLSSRKRLTETEAAALFRQIVQAVDFCHSRGVVHRDIKPENIMLTTATDLRTYELSLQAKLGDFGHSIVLGPDQLTRGVVGSPSYISPEAILGKAYDYASDIWSLGVVLYVMLSGLLPFLGNTNQDTFDLIVNCAPDLNVASPWRDVSPSAKNLVKRMLNHIPHLRPTPSEILSHPWFVSSSMNGVYL